jgi:hypothetical protein
MPRTRNVIIGFVGAGAILFAGVGIGAAGKPTSGHAGPVVTMPTITVSPSAAPAVTVTVRPVAPKPASPHASMAGDGVFVVGTDIEPGTYHTSGAVGGSGGNCYYALLSSTNTSDIIDNNDVTGPATITVGAGVKAVDISGCQVWTRV